MSSSTDNRPRRNASSPPRERPRPRSNADGQVRRTKTVRRPARRAVGVEPARRGPDRNEPRRPPKRRLVVPLAPAMVMLVVCVVATALITRAVVLSGVDSVQTTNASKQAGHTSAQASAVERNANSATTEQEQTTTNNTIDSATTQEGLQGNATSSSSTSSSSSGFKATPGDGVKSPWLKSATFTTGDETLDEEVKEFCDSKVSTDMDVDSAALEVYKGVAWSEYVERDDAQKPAGKDWRIEYARKYYEHDCSGNCYEFASFLSFCLQYLGFTDAHAEGVLIEKESGSWGDHGLVYVTNTDGTKSLCDTSLGTNGWMLKETAYNVQLQDFENA